MAGNSGDLNVQKIGASQGAAISVLFNGSRYYMDPNPYIRSGRTLVPMKRVFELFGSTPVWNNTERSVTATRGGDTIKLYIGKKTAYINGSPVVLDVPAEISAGRTMVPLRFVAEALGCYVDWDSQSQTVVIKSSI
jgi:hypothetical protein